MAEQLSPDEVARLRGTVGPNALQAQPGEYPDLLTPGEVARLLKVDPKTVSRWGKAGKLSCVRTPGNHRRFFADEVYALLDRRGPS